MPDLPPQSSRFIRFTRRGFVAAFGAGALAGVLRPPIHASVSEAAPNINSDPERSIRTALDEVLGESLTLEEFHRRITSRMAGLHSRDALTARAKSWSELFPDQARRLILMATTEREGRLILPGTNNQAFFVGSPPRWHSNPVNDAEFTWSLNRMFHWPHLLRASAVTGDPSYAERVGAEFDDWIRTCPCPLISGDIAQLRANFDGPTPWRSLEAGIRMYESWPAFLQMLAGLPVLTPSRLAQFAVSVHEHGRVLSQVTPRFWPNADHNHYLSEQLGLLTLACLLPELHSASEWKLQAWREINRCLDTQLTADGAQIEGSPHYHNVCIRLFCRAAMTARENDLEITRHYTERLAGALAYSAHSLRPTGAVVPWADGDASANGIEAALWGTLASDDLTTLGAVRSLASKAAFNDACSTVFWYSNDPMEWIKRTRSPAPGAMPLFHCDRGVDQVMMRTSWDPDALSVFCGCHTPVQNGHAHIDPGSFDLTGFGRALMVDPGRFTYRDCDDRKNFKSATWHNTVTIDGREPFEYLDSFRFGPQREGRIIKTYQVPNLVGADLLNKNFFPAQHRRLVALVNNYGLLIVDELSNLSRTSSVERWFHFDSQRVKWDAAAQIAHSEDDARPNVVIYSSGVSTGELLPGKVSEALDVAHPSTRLKLSSAGVSERCALAVLIVPLRARSVYNSKTKLSCSLQLGGWDIRIQSLQESDTMTVLWQPGGKLEIAKSDL